MNLESELRRLMTVISREMYHRRYVIATEGNLSCRVDAERLLVTPTAKSKGQITEEDLVVTDMEGHAEAGRPTTEIELHLKVYRERRDVNAVVHAHPPFAIALTVADVPLATWSLPELVAVFGEVAVAPYAQPGPGGGLAATIEGFVKHTSAILLEKHGTLTYGRTLIEAYEHLERLEWAAEITVWAKILGKVESLPPEAVQALLARRR